MKPSIKVAVAVKIKSRSKMLLWQHTFRFKVQYVSYRFPPYVAYNVGYGRLVRYCFKKQKK